MKPSWVPASIKLSAAVAFWREGVWIHKPEACYYLVNRPEGSWSQHFDFLKLGFLQNPQQSLIWRLATWGQGLNQLGEEGFWYVKRRLNTTTSSWRLRVKPSHCGRGTAPLWLICPRPTSRSWSSRRVVLFLLMWRRRSSTKTERPAIRMTRSPPTTPAAIMERPELKDTRLILNMLATGKLK